MKCLICKKSETVKFLDDYKLEITDEVDALLLARTKARADKDWSKADEIRDKLQQMGVVVTDTADGPTWDLA